MGTYPKFILAIFLVMGFIFFLHLKPASAAECYLDFYGGLAMTENADVYAGIDNKDENKENRNLTRSQDFTNTGTYGVKGRYWLRKVPYFGLAIDSNYIRLKSDDVSGKILTISPLLMARLPLFVNQTYTHGRLQPYVGAGVGLSYSEIEVDYRPYLSRVLNHGIFGLPGVTTIGLLWQFSELLGTFIEYRYTNLVVNTFQNKECNNNAGDDCVASDEKEEIKTNLSIHGLVMGLSISF